MEEKVSIKPTNLKRRQQELRAVAAEKLAKDKRIKVFTSDVDPEIDTMNRLKIINDEAKARRKLEAKQALHSDKYGLPRDQGNPAFLLSSLLVCLFVFPAFILNVIQLSRRRG